MRVLVTGATGGVGRGVVRGLVSDGRSVRALSRDASTAIVSAGVEVVAGDLLDPTSMTRALEGVNAVFLYAPARSEKLVSLMETMKSAGVEHVVVLSTNEHEYARHNRRRHLAVEEAVADAGFRHTFLRPGAFARNAIRFWARGIAADGVARLPYPEAQQAPIDEHDIATVAVRALTSSDLDGKALVLTGPESLTQRRQLEIIAGVVERAIRIETVSDADARADLERIMPIAYVDLLLAQWADEVGARAVVTDAVERVTGRPATTYATWVGENAARFGSPTLRQGLA